MIEPLKKKLCGHNFGSGKGVVIDAGSIGLFISAESRMCSVKHLLSALRIGGASVEP